MLTRVIKKNWEENKKKYIVAGALIGVGVVIGMNYQRNMDVNNLIKNIKKGKALVPNMGEKLLPELFASTKTLAELKDAAVMMDASIADAIVVTIDGLPMLFVR